MSVDATLLIPELWQAWQELALRLAASSGIVYKPYLGYRDPSLQAALYAKYQAGGPRAAPPWSSAHQWGLAIDVEAYLDGTAASWQDADYKPLIDALNAHPTLASGASFHDADHIELRYPPGPWDARVLGVLPKLYASELVTRAWPLVRIMIARTSGTTVQEDGG